MEIRSSDGVDGLQVLINQCENIDDIQGVTDTVIVQSINDTIGVQTG